MDYRTAIQVMEDFKEDIQAIKGGYTSVKIFALINYADERITKYTLEYAKQVEDENERLKGGRE